VIRPYRPADREALLALNAANVPEVGPMDGAKLELLLAEALRFDVVELDGAIEGALVVLGDGGTYRSPNYRWFAERHERFAYVDRVMLSERLRGQGWGKALYDAAVATARALGKPVLTAEVNTLPPNPRSFRFHEGCGFVEVGRQRPYGPDEEVAMFELVVDADPRAAP
jgi:predicted GNAT superfamily acetyltransferase